MPLHHAVLSLLAEGPSYGYEIKGAFERSVGPQWGPLNIGHVYQVLERLKRDGLVTATKVVRDVKPDRVMYEITESGRAELMGWLDSPSPRPSGFRDDFFLKLMAAVLSRDDATLRTVVGHQRALLVGELRNLAPLRRDHVNDLVVSLLLSAAERHIAADLAFLDDAEESLRAHPSWTTAVARPRPTTMDSPGAAPDERSA